MIAPLAPTILFEDPHLVVLSKPPGLLSQGEITGDENLVDWLRTYFGRNYVGLIHRLDRNTSGVMVVAKRTKSAQRLTDSLQKGDLERSYLAWIQGRLSEPQRWRHFLLKDERLNRVRVIQNEKTPEAKEAILRLSPVFADQFQGREITLAHFVLETGRSHQIRAQAAYEKHPLLGDRKYGDGAGFSRPALHSYQLTFPHPMSKETMTFTAPLPDDFRAVSKSNLLDKALSLLELGSSKATKFPPKS